MVTVKVVKVKVIEVVKVVKVKIMMKVKMKRNLLTEF